MSQKSEHRVFSQVHRLALKAGKSGEQAHEDAARAQASEAAASLFPRYLTKMVNYRNTPEDLRRADAVPLNDLTIRFDHKDGSVTINYLVRSPVQHGQNEWVG